MKNRKTAVIISYVYFLLNTVVSILLSSFIIKMVGQTSFGVYQTMTAFVSYLILLEFGTGTIMTRNLSLCRTDYKKPSSEENKQASTIFITCFFLSFLILVFAVVFFFLIPTIYSNSLDFAQIESGRYVFAFSVVNLLFSFLTTNLNGLLLAYEFYVFEKIALLAKLILRTVSLVIVLFISPNILYIAIIDAIIGACFFLVTLIYCFRKIKIQIRFRFFDPVIVKAIIPLCLALLMQTVVNTVNSNVDKFIIGIMMTPDDVAIYSIAMTIFTMFSTIGTIPTSIYMPKLATNIKNGMEGQKLTESLVQICRINIIIMGLILFGFVSIGRQFVCILYGDEFINSWLYAVIIMVPMFINLSNNVIVNIVDIYKKRHIRSIILLLSAIFNVVLTIFGIKFFGMLGAAISTAISVILDFVILNIWYNKRTKLNIIFLFRKSFGWLPIVLILSTACSCAASYFISNIIAQFFVGGVVFVVLFLFLYLLFGANASEREKIKSLLKKGKKA